MLANVGQYFVWRLREVHTTPRTQPIFGTRAQVERDYKSALDFMSAVGELLSGQLQQQQDEAEEEEEGGGGDGGGGTAAGAIAAEDTERDSYVCVCNARIVVPVIFIVRRFVCSVVRWLVVLVVLVGWGARLHDDPTSAQASKRCKCCHLLFFSCFDWFTHHHECMYVHTYIHTCRTEPDQTGNELTMISS